MPTKIIHFSIDDCIEIFRDITINNYNSLFESKYFNFFKKLHDEYNAYISLYIFIEYNGFNISNTSNKYKSEFQSISNWLKIGFHGYDENSRYNSNKKLLKRDYKLFLKYLYNFTGTYDIVDHIPRLHYFSGNLINLLSIRKLKNGAIGFLTADDDRDNYYLNKNENIFLNKHGEYKDIKNDILFIKTTLRAEHIKDIDSSIKNIDLNNNIILFTHEVFLEDDNIKNNILRIYDYASKNSYTPNFAENINILNDIKLEKIKKFIDTYIPITKCNLKCSYCYITQSNLWDRETQNISYSPLFIRKALSKKRLGGACLLNICGGGETLLAEGLIDVIKELLEEGHYIWIITNATITKKFDEIYNKIPLELRFRLAFKCSFHYIELKRLNLLDTFVNNINKIQSMGCSYSIEITPHDELIKYIDEIKEFSYLHFGALPHITVARDNNCNKKILTNLSKEEYNKIWSDFDSQMFSFKLSTFEIKRKEYCHAGKWSFTFNIFDGSIQKCYSYDTYYNIYNNLEEKIPFSPVGKKCKEPHCYNGHAFLTFGNITSLKTPYYNDMRNRIMKDKNEWLNPYMKEFCSHKLKENN